MSRMFLNNELRLFLWTKNESELFDCLKMFVILANYTNDAWHSQELDNTETLKMQLNFLPYTIMSPHPSNSYNIGA